MIRMTSEELFDSLAIDCQLLFNDKEHLRRLRANRLLALVLGALASTQLGCMSEDLHAAGALVAAPEPAAVQELLPLSLAGLGQQLGAGKTLEKHPGRDRSPILKGL